MKVIRRKLEGMKEIVRVNGISEVHKTFGYATPKHPLVSVLPITDEMTNYDYGDFSYTMDLFSISLKQGINGSLTYGRNSYDFQEGTILFTKPDQVIKIENSEEMSGSSGWTLMFHPDLIRKSELGRTIDKYAFFGYEVNEALHLSEDEINSLTELTEKIKKEYEQSIDRHSQELIISNIKMLLDYCTRYYDRQFYTRTNLNQDYVSKFERVLKDYYDNTRELELGLPTVKYLAAEIGMSSSYLSELLKKEVGRSAQDQINHFIIERAKTLLLSTSDSISEIAYGLGFQYPQGFSKMFKKKTGKTPAEYRVDLN